MSRTYDNWEKLVQPVLDREKLRELALAPSRESSFNSIQSDFSSRFSFDSTLEDHVPSPEFPGFPSNSAASSSPQCGENSFENLGFIFIEFEELKLATSNSRFLLGKGRFRSVFKGWIHRQSFTGAKPGFGVPVAVEQWNNNPLQGHKEWALRTELHYLGLYHENTINLIGYCFGKTELVLVYDSMPNGSLENRLFRGEVSLSWATRINVAIDVARALTSLHDRPIGVVHGNVKASNILLDLGFNAKLSGFGSAKYSGWAQDMCCISTRFGTHSFSDGIFSLTEHSTKDDVNDFGVVLLQLLSGRRDVAKTDFHMGDETKLLQIIDTKLKWHYPRKIGYEVASLALRCVNPVPFIRPSMAEVLFSLEQLRLDKSTVTDTKKQMH